MSEISTFRLHGELLDSRVLLTADMMAATALAQGSIELPPAAGVIEVSSPVAGLESADELEGQPLAGDANHDGVFDQLDVLQVLRAGKYLTGEPADWGEGDWNGDHVFDQRDLVAAFQAGNFNEAPFLARPGFGQLYHDGEIVRTIVPPAAAPKEGVDNLYVIPDQLAVAAVAPGDRDYHGGKWAVHTVSWNVAPYDLTSEEEVLAAESAGDVDVTRVPENDFKCPVQP